MLPNLERMKKKPEIRTIFQSYGGHQGISPPGDSKYNCFMRTVLLSWIGVGGSHRAFRRCQGGRYSRENVHGCANSSSGRTFRRCIERSCPTWKGKGFLCRSTSRRTFRRSSSRTFRRFPSRTFGRAFRRCLCRWDTREDRYCSSTDFEVTVIVGSSCKSRILVGIFRRYLTDHKDGHKKL